MPARTGLRKRACVIISQISGSFKTQDLSNQLPTEKKSSIDALLSVLVKERILERVSIGVYRKRPRRVSKFEPVENKVSHADLGKALVNRLVAQEQEIVELQSKLNSLQERYNELKLRDNGSSVSLKTLGIKL